MKCKYCGGKLPKGRKKFCSNRHKDKWHNWNNPRGRFKHLADVTPGVIEDDMHPQDPYALGQE